MLSRSHPFEKRRVEPICESVAKENAGTKIQSAGRHERRLGLSPCRGPSRAPPGVFDRDCGASVANTLEEHVKGELPNPECGAPDGEDVEVRRAVLSDSQAVIDTMRRCTAWLDAQGIHQWDGSYPSMSKVRHDIERGAMNVAVRGTSIAGAVVLDQREDTEYSSVKWTYERDCAGVVHRLMVRPNLQRQGLGRRLMMYVEGEARLRGYTSIRLDAFLDNRGALGLYHDMGYSEVGCIELNGRVFVCFEKGLR